MDMSFLYDNRGVKLSKPYKQKNSWFEWFRLRYRKPNSEEEINEVHDLIRTVYESMDDQARAVLLSLSKIIQNEDKSIVIEDRIKAIVAIGHTLCCADMQIKNSVELYAKLFIQPLSHEDLRMRLAAMIAIGEVAIDNLPFQMKLNELDMMSKLFEIMKTSMSHVDHAFDNINEYSKLVAWSCYTIVNICADCIPNILVLKNIVPTELETLKNAVQLKIWSCIWRENYAQTIVEFADNSEQISDIINIAVQPKPNLLENSQNHIEQLPNESISIDNRRSSIPISSPINYQRCEIL